MSTFRMQVITSCRYMLWQELILCQQQPCLTESKGENDWIAIVPMPKLGLKPCFTPPQEEDLEDLLVSMSKQGFGLTRLHVRRLAYAFAQKLGIPCFSKKTNLAGVWLASRIFGKASKVNCAKGWKFIHWKSHEFQRTCCGEAFPWLVANNDGKWPTR